MTRVTPNSPLLTPSLLCEANQFHADIDIKIADDESWSLETKQFIKILDVKSQGSRAVGIGDLPKATIVILNDDDFPSAMGPETMEGDHLKYFWTQPVFPL